MIAGSLLWPIDRAGEAMEAVARASVWIGGTAQELPHYDGGDADSWIAACATSLRIECDPIVLRYGGLLDSLRALGPSVMRVGDEFLAILQTTSRHALAMTPDGTKARVPLRELAAIAGGKIEEQFAAEADRTLAFADSGTSRRFRARALLIAEFAGNAAVPGFWILRAPIEQVYPHAREGRIAGGIVAFGASQLAQTLLLLSSWWILGAIAFGNASETGLLLLWLLVSFTALPIRWLGSIAGRTAALQSATLLKRRLLAGGLKLEPDEVHGHGIGAFMAHVFESAAVENLGTHGLTITVTAIATTLGAVVTLALGAGGFLHATLFVLWIAICGAVTANYYLRRRGWTDARFALTRRVIENLTGHKTRLVQKIAAERNEAEDLLLSDYVCSETRLNRSALILDIGSRAWPWVGLLGIAPLLIGGGYDQTAMALSVGGILLGTMALNLWIDGTVLFSAASIAWRRLSGYWRIASRTQAPGSASARAAVDRPASPGIPLIEMSSVVFRHRNRERPTIDSASLTIAEGDRILLGGRSGSGKSTLSMLLSGGRPMQSGLLFFRGLDIASIGTANWRRRVMLVPQFYANHIFSASLAYNLLLGRAWPASADDLTAAEATCREVGLGPLLDRMPLALEQPVGETGWQLSHGERTRVFLARALLQEPALMILDETFAALDPETLAEAMSAVLTRPSAVLVIAHV
jgi:ATP-binding cassette, subfamily B, bacterial